MQEKIKNILGIALIAAVLIIAGAAAGYVYYYGRSAGSVASRSFSVTEQGKVTVVPDIAEFTVSVVTEGGSDLKLLQTENSIKTNQVIAFVKSKGVETKDIETKSYEIDPRYEYSRCLDSGVCPPPKMVGYRISQTAFVKVRKIENAGEILSGVVGAGANSVSQLKFTVDDLTQLRNQARAEAITKAKQKAEAIAEATGFKMGRLIGLYEDNVYMYGEGVGGEGVSEAKVMSTPDIQPGAQEVKAIITLTYEIE